MFSLICTRINGWVNNGEAGDLRRHRAHYDVTVMYCHTADVREQCLRTHDIDLLFSWNIRIRFILLWDYVCDSIAIDYVLNITILVRVTLVVLGYSGKLGQHPTTTKQNKTSTWWRHQMETFSALLAFCAGKSPVTWVLSAPDGPHVGPMNLAIRVYIQVNVPLSGQYHTTTTSCHYMHYIIMPSWQRLRYAVDRHGKFYSYAKTDITSSHDRLCR